MMERLTNQALADCEVLVLGGGPAGALVSIALCSAGIKPIALHGSERGVTRYEAFPPEIAEIFLKANLWAEFHALCEEFQFLPSPGVASFWGSEKITEQDYFFELYANGWYVDRQIFDHFLRRIAVSRGCHFLETRGIFGAERRANGGRWRVAIRTSSETLIAQPRFVVDATGRKSVMSRKRGTYRFIDGRQIAIMARIPSVTKLVDHRLFLESTDKGWWYRMPTGTSHSLAAYITDSDLLPRSRHERSEFLAFEWSRLQIGKENGAATLLPDFGNSQTVPANCGISEQASGPGWLAIGDAALTADPLSGKGVMRACGEAIAAAEIITNAIAGNEDAASYHQTVMDEARIEYLKIRQRMFQLEMRWATSPFWQRRHAQQDGRHPVARSKSARHA